MGGGLMQLVAYGAQDIYLTGNPQITFFKVVYRRHTNFSMETIEQTINGNPQEGGSSSVTISRNGDLVHRIYVTSTSTSNNISYGSAIISEVELEIGGQRIDKQTTEWMQIWTELSISGSKIMLLKEMVGDGENQAGLGALNAVRMVQIPLQFWFCRNPGLALPLIALQYHEVKLKFNWGTVEGVEESKVMCDYIYLDTDERRRFAQVSHEYLIEQIQIQSMSGTASQKLNFNHPVKELIWTNQGNNYDTAQLVLNGHDRFSAQGKDYFQFRQPFDYHTNIPFQNLPTGDAQVSTHHYSSKASANGSIKMTSRTLSLNAHSSINSVTAQVTKELVLSDQSATVGIRIGITAGGAEYMVLDADSLKSVTGNVPLNTSVSTSGGTTNTTKLVLSSTGHIVGDVRQDIVFEAVASTGNINTGHVTFTFEVTTNIIADVQKGYASNLAKRINVYSFALKPEEHQPSGTCNFSRIDTAILNFTKTLTDEAYPDTSSKIYAVNYNVLRIMSGMGGLAYSN